MTDPPMKKVLLGKDNLSCLVLLGKGESPTWVVAGGWEGVGHLLGSWEGQVSYPLLNKMAEAYESITFPGTTYVVH